MSAPGRLRVQVDDEFGTVTEMLDLTVLAGLTARQLRQLGELGAGLTGKLAAALGRTEDQAREVAVCMLARQIADEAAYERVAARLGVLF